MQKVLRNSTVLMNTHAQKHVPLATTLAVRVLMVETETATLWHIINTHCSTRMMKPIAHVLVCVWELRVCYDSVPLL